MHRPFRFRRFAKWSCTAGVFIAAVLFAISNLYGFGYRWISSAHVSGVFVERDGVILVWNSPLCRIDDSQLIDGWLLRKTGQDPRDERLYSQYLVPYGVAQAPLNVTGIPISISLFVLFLASAVLWLVDKPPPRGFCQDCAYDLTGNNSGICPECGAHTRLASKRSEWLQT